MKQAIEILPSRESERKYQYLRLRGRYLAWSFDYAGAKKMFEESLFVAEHQEPQNPFKISEALGWLADNSRGFGFDREAERYWQRAFTTIQSSLKNGDSSYDAFEAMLTIAVRSRFDGDSKLAEEYLLRCLNIWREEYDQKQPNFAIVNTNLADVYISMRRLKDAEAAATKAYNYMLKRKLTTHEAFAFTADALSGIKFMQNDFSGAKELALEGLRIRERIFGPVSKNVENSLYNLALIEDRLSSPTIAACYLGRVLEIQKRSVGIEHEQYRSAKKLHDGILIKGGGQVNTNC